MKHFKKYGLHTSVWLACVCSAGLAAAQNNDSAGRESLPTAPQAGAVTVPDDKPISLNFQKIDIKALLQVFADFSGLNLVPTDSVNGPVTVRLSEVPWQQALSIVLQSKGLVSRQEGRVLWIAPQGEWALREKKELDAQAALEAVSPLQMLSLRLQYARATEVAQRLQGGAAGSTGGRWLSARGSVLAEPRTNQLFISDLPARVLDLQKMLVQLDVPVRQVLIEARIVEADDQFGQSLGVRLGTGLAIPMKVQGRSSTLAMGASNQPAAAGTVASAAAAILQPGRSTAGVIRVCVCV